MSLAGTGLKAVRNNELPTADNVYRMLVGMGIRGLLPNFSAVLVGRPKTQHRGYLPQEGREKYLVDQRETIIKALKECAPDVHAVFGLDFGHTDPQILVPSGGIANINGDTGEISFCYK